MSELLKIATLALFATVAVFAFEGAAIASNVDMLDQVYNQPFSQQELDQINTLFPEYGGLDQSLLNPANGLDLYFNQDAQLTFTFISEGAGYKNSVGLFTYDEDFNILSEVTIFSNASGAGAGLTGGGALNAGDTVDLGTFTAGTRLGFWLQGDGYNNNNGPVYYTRETLNPDGKNHFALWVDTSRQRLVYGVEDLPNLGDRDYNDLVFTIGVNPLNATNQGSGATPEPASLVLMGSALGLWAGFRERRARRNRG